MVNDRLFLSHPQSETLAARFLFTANRPMGKAADFKNKGHQASLKWGQPENAPKQIYLLRCCFFKFVQSIAIDGEEKSGNPGWDTRIL